MPFLGELRTALTGRRPWEMGKEERHRDLHSKIRRIAKVDNVREACKAGSGGHLHAHHTRVDAPVSVCLCGEISVYVAPNVIAASRVAHEASRRLLRCGDGERRFPLCVCLFVFGVRWSVLRPHEETEMQIRGRSGERGGEAAERSQVAKTDI